LNSNWQPASGQRFDIGTAHGTHCASVNCSTWRRTGDDIQKRFEPAQIGERIDARIARRVDHESGSFAVFDQSRDFKVHLRDLLEWSIGKATTGIMCADGIS
jgi:hypothetical protein